MKTVLLILLLAALTACTPAASIDDFCTPLDAEQASALVYCTDDFESRISLGPARIADIFSMLRHAEYHPADAAPEWEVFEYRLDLCWPDARLQLGWSPNQPAVVCAQWTEGGLYTKPVWLRNPALPGKLLSFLPMQDLHVQWTVTSDGNVTRGHTLSDAQRLAVTLHCLFECTLTDRTPKEAVSAEAHTVEMYSKSRLYRYTAYPEDGEWLLETSAGQVYRIPPAAIEACRLHLDPPPESQPVIISSGGDEITVPLVDMDGAMYGQPLLPILESTPDAFGLPFSVCTADGTPCKWFHARLQQTADERHWLEGRSPRYSNDFLGDRTWTLTPGHPYLVTLTVCSSPTQLMEGSGNIYYFKIIPR